MRVVILFHGFRHCLDVSPTQTVADMKQLLRKKFDLDTVQNEETENDIFLSLNYAGGVLEDDWIFADIGIPPGVTLRCELIQNTKSYLNVHCAYSGEIVKFTEPMSLFDTTVGDLKTMVTNKTGLHVSVFRLVIPEGKEMFDCNLLKDYNISTGDTIRLETWNGWADFLKAATKGQLTPTLKHMLSISEDPLVAKYQQRVALFIAAHFGYSQLAALLLKQGARSDEAVGEHPVREWCNKQVHLDHYKTPIHEAAQQGQLLCLRQFIHHNYTCILVKDASGLTPCNIARRFKHIECFKLLIAEQFRSRTTEGLTITLYAKVKKWCERARDRALVFHKHNPSPLLLAMEKRTYRKAVVGQKLQVDGFGKSLQTTAPTIELSLVSLPGKSSKALAITGALDVTSGKSTKAAKQSPDATTSAEITEITENEGSDKACENHSSNQRDETTKERQGNANYSLPAVLESRFYGDRSKLSTAQRGKAKHKADRAAFSSYRWKQTSYDERHIESVAGAEGEHATSERRVSMPAINNIDRGREVEGKQTKQETFFVTERIMGERKPRIHAWERKEENELTPKEASITKMESDRMPPIRTSSSPPGTGLSGPQETGLSGLPGGADDAELKPAKKWRRKDSPHKAKSEGFFRHKQSFASAVSSKKTAIHHRSVSEDPCVQTTALYRQVTGNNRRDSARASLDVAMTFNKKTWLQQVQLAIDLNTNTFRRQALSPRNATQNTS